MMALPIVIDITGHLKDIELLKGYRNMRNYDIQNFVICTKFSLLQDVPQLYLGEFNRGYIIHYLSQKYMHKTSMINANPNLKKLYVFTFPGNIYFPDIILSNQMSFDEDILIMSYIYKFMNNFEYVGCIVLMVMMSLMTDKYEIDVNVQTNLMNINSFNLDPNAITFMNISLTYLSLSLDLMSNNSSKLSLISTFFPCFNLPIMIFAPHIYPILPKLNDFPIATLMVICFVFNKLCMPESHILLSDIYQLIVSYNISLFPETVKLQLCMRYNIVVLDGGEFKYAPCFAECRQKAKDLISEFRPNEPNLGDILPRI